MYKKIILCSFYLGVMTTEGRIPRPGAISRRCVQFIERVQKEVPLVKERIQAHVKTVIIAQAAMREFVKADEFKDLVKQLIAEQKEDLKKKCECLKEHSMNEGLRIAMAHTVAVETTNSLQQVLNTKPTITSVDICTAVLLAFKEYADENIQRKK